MEPPAAIKAAGQLLSRRQLIMHEIHRPYIVRPHHRLAVVTQLRPNRRLGPLAKL